MSELTLNEALIWMKTLRERHKELIGLRDENSHKTTRRFGMGGDKEVTTDPTYDVKKLDRLVSNVAKEIRTLDMAIKSTNGVTKVIGYNHDDAVLGEVE